MPASCRDSQTCSQGGLPSWAPQCSLTKAPAHRHLPVSKSKCAWFSSPDLPLHQSPLPQVKGSSTCWVVQGDTRSGVPHPLPMCGPSPMPLPALIICHLTTAAVPRLPPACAPHPSHMAAEPTTALFRVSKHFPTPGEMPPSLHVMLQHTWWGRAQASLWGPRSCFPWLHIETHKWDCWSIQ